MKPFVIGIAGNLILPGGGRNPVALETLKAKAPAHLVRTEAA